MSIIDTNIKEWMLPIEAWCLENNFHRPLNLLNLVLQFRSLYYILTNQHTWQYLTVSYYLLTFIKNCWYIRLTFLHEHIRLYMVVYWLDAEELGSSQCNNGKTSRKQRLKDLHIGFWGYMTLTYANNSHFQMTILYLYIQYLSFECKNSNHSYVYV